MREFVRPVAAALGVACLAAAIATASAGEALAQAREAPPQQSAPAPQAAPAQLPVVKQIALTDKHIEGVLAAQKDMDAITAKLIDNAEAIARKNGFAGYDEYSNVVDNISIVLAGFDPATKRYVGTDAVIKAQIAQIEADKKMSPNEKKEALAELNDALKAPVPPIENKGNIDLVAKYYDKLADALGDDQE
jgi:hypothetical protein